MKKFIVFTLFGLLIMAFSTMAYAQKLEFKASGSIDFDTVLNVNVPFYFGAVAAAQGAHTGVFQTWTTPAFNTALPISRPTKSLDHNTAYAYSRGLLRFDAIMDPNLSGTIYFEIDALRWGAATAGNITQASFRNNLGSWSTDQAAVEVKNVYIDVGLPYFGIPAPMTVRVGAQPFGVRPTMVVYTDGVGITGGIKVDPVTIIPMWFKILEGADYASDDSDVYGLHVNAKVGTFTVGGYGLYYNMNTYPFQYMTGINWAALTSNPNSGATSASYGTTIAGTQMANMWWLGVYADGKAGPVDLNFDFVYDFGKVESRPNVSGVFVPEVKYRGWATRGKVDLPWEKLNFGAIGMYASGADANKTSTSGLPGTGVANPAAATAGKISRKVGSYMVPPGSEQSPASGGLNDSLVMYSCFNAVADGGTGIAQAGNYQQMSRGSYGGTWFAKLYGSVKATPWYKLTLQGLYIGDTTSHGNTLGTARKNPTAASTAQILRDDNDIGWEFDLINEVQIYKNLTFFFGGGYLFAGDALDVFKLHGTVGGDAANKNFSPKNPWIITTRLLYTF